MKRLKSIKIDTQCEGLSWQTRNGRRLGKRSIQDAWYLCPVTQESIIPEAGELKDLCMISPGVLNVVFAISSVLRDVLHKMRMDILWQIWITARVVAFALTNAGRVQ